MSMSVSGCECVSMSVSGYECVWRGEGCGERERMHMAVLGRRRLHLTPLTGNHCPFMVGVG